MLGIWAALFSPWNMNEVPLPAYLRGGSLCFYLQDQGRLDSANLPLLRQITLCCGEVARPIPALPHSFEVAAVVPNWG